MLSILTYDSYATVSIIAWSLGKLTIMVLHGCQHSIALYWRVLWYRPNTYCFNVSFHPVVLSIELSFHTLVVDTYGIDFVVMSDKVSLVVLCGPYTPTIQQICGCSMEDANEESNFVHPATLCLKVTLSLIPRSED